MDLMTAGLVFGIFAVLVAAVEVLWAFGFTWREVKEFWLGQLDTIVVDDFHGSSEFQVKNVNGLEYVVPKADKKEQ